MFARNRNFFGKSQERGSALATNHPDIRRATRGVDPGATVDDGADEVIRNAVDLEAQQVVTHAAEEQGVHQATTPGIEGESGAHPVAAIPAVQAETETA